MAIDVEVYRETMTGPALDTRRPLTLEDEIAEHALVTKRNIALHLTLKNLVAKLEEQLREIRCARTIPFPLLTPEETRVWAAFLPTVYRYPNEKNITPTPTRRWWVMGAVNTWGNYQFDEPPLLVLETIQQVFDEKLFNYLELWTPERPMPEPICVGWKVFDQSTVGPFLISRWGESLAPFVEIKKAVDSRATPNVIQPFISNPVIQPFINNPQQIFPLQGITTNPPLGAWTTTSGWTVTQ